MELNFHVKNKVSFEKKPHENVNCVDHLLISPCELNPLFSLKIEIRSRFMSITPFAKEGTRNTILIVDLSFHSQIRRMSKLFLALIDSFYFLFRRFMPLKTYRYAVCGGGNLVFDIVLYFLMYNYVVAKHDLDLGLFVLSPHIAALFIVFPITFVTGFLLNKYVAFHESDLKGKVQFYRYFMVAMGAIGLNYLLMKLFVDAFGFFPTPSKILVTIIAVVYSYTLQNRYSFRITPKDKEEDSEI